MDVTVWLYQVCLRIVHVHSTEVKSKEGRIRCTSAVIDDLLWGKPLLCCRDLSNLRWNQLITIYKPIHSTFLCIGENCAKQCKSIWHFKQTHGATSLAPHSATTHATHHTVQTHHLANWPDRVSRLGLPRPGKVLSNVKQNIALRRYYTNMRNNLASCFRDFGRKFVGSRTYGANIMPYYGANASLYTSTEIWGQKIW